MEDLKKIIAVFIKKDPESISDSTLINKKAIAGSILIHRMYAAISKAGYAVADYSNINTYGELTSVLNNSYSADTTNVIVSKKTPAGYDTITNDNNLIGVDIESIDNFPIADDIREHEFYINNFSAEEISYSLMKPNPYETLAGLFSAKEALCKVDNNLISVPFSQINIKHTVDGKPIFNGYSISISHTQSHSIAVALTDNAQANINTGIHERENIIMASSAFSQKNNIINLVSLILSVFSILIAIALLCLYLIKF